MHGSHLLRNAIFDLDGTLVDSAADIRTAIVCAYAAIGIEGMGDKIEQLVIGPPLPEMVRRLTPNLRDEQYAALVHGFRQIYDNCPHAQTRVYPGVWGVLDELRDSGATLLLATNKPSQATRRVLEKTGLAACFRDVVTPDTLFSGQASKAAMVAYLIEKWGLDREVTFVLGDAAADVAAAHDNGVGSVALLSGYGNRDELIDCRPTVLLESMGGLSSCGQFHFR
jgi:phosphoglycolate phosphatase